MVGLAVSYIERVSGTAPFGQGATTRWDAKGRYVAGFRVRNSFGTPADVPPNKRVPITLAEVDSAYRLGQAVLAYCAQ